MQTSYTFSRARDNGQSSQTFTSGNNVLNPYDLGGEDAISNFDVPHRFSFSAVWQPHSDSVWLDHFTFAPIIRATSGTPARSSGSAPPANGSAQASRAGGSSRLPSLERNTFRTPYQTNVDFRLSRSFNLPGKSRIEVLAEAFNLFNRINYTKMNNSFYAIGGTRTT